LKLAQVRHQIFIFGILLFAVSIPTSKFGMSLSQMILAANWLFDKDVYQKTKLFFSQKIALVFGLIFFVHLCWLLNTANFSYAMDDLRTKAPIFILAVIFSTTPRLSKKEFYFLLLTHISAVFLTSMISASIYFTENPADFRLISPFISHIRLALNVCIAIFSLLYFIFNNPFHLNRRLLIAQKSGFILILLWLLSFLSMLQSFTGIGIVFFVFLSICLKSIYQSSISKIAKILFTGILILAPVACFFTLFHSYRNYSQKPTVILSNLDTVSKYGGIYRQDTINFKTENGKWIGLYLCEPELQHGWNQRSKIKYNTPDTPGSTINYTLIRYLTSKGLRKDFDGVNALSDQDVKNIEKGIANIEYTQGSGINSRLYKLFWEYQEYKDHGVFVGHSLFQRLELWKTSWSVIKSNWLFGVGTGDVPDVFKQTLKNENSPLQDTKLRSHNQYLSLFIAFGVVGFLLCLFSFIYPFIKSKLIFDYFCTIFLIVFLMSMLTEDTIESQDGVTFYAFFAALYLFQKPLKKEALLTKTED
jgi:hypothetical protein